MQRLRFGLGKYIKHSAQTGFRVATYLTTRMKIYGEPFTYETFIWFAQTWILCGRMISTYEQELFIVLFVK